MENTIVENKKIQARKGKPRKKQLFRASGQIFLLLGLMSAIFFCFYLWPSFSGPMAAIMMIGGLGMTVIFAVQRNVKIFKLGKITRQVLMRKNVVDVLGILLTMAAVIITGGFVSRYVGQLAGKAAETTSPGTGSTVAMLAGILSGGLVGLGVSFLMRGLLGKLTKPKRVGSAPSA